jgi:hypothetical protein
MDTAIIISHGKHKTGDCKLCLLEWCSLPLDLLEDLEREESRQAALARLRETPITDDPPDVCTTRGAFGRTLNDSYPMTPEGDIERTEDLGEMRRLLRGTASLNDSGAVAMHLTDLAFREWWPRSLEATSKMLTLSFASCGDEKLIARCAVSTSKIDEVVAALRALPKFDGPLADLAARAALADLADLADLAARAARAAREQRSRVVALVVELADMQEAA